VCPTIRLNPTVAVIGLFGDRCTEKVQEIQNPLLVFCERHDKYGMNPQNFWYKIQVLMFVETGTGKTETFAPNS